MADTNTDSILISTRKLLGSDPYFDPDLIIHINSVFGILAQIGVGPEDGYAITDENDTWTDYISDNNKILNMVKSYMYFKVKIMFDSASDNSYLIDTFKQQAAELEWRLNIEVDPKKKGGE